MQKCVDCVPPSLTPNAVFLLKCLFLWLQMSSVPLKRVILTVQYPVLPFGTCWLSFKGVEAWVHEVQKSFDFTRFGIIQRFAKKDSTFSINKSLASYLITVVSCRAFSYLILGGRAINSSHYRISDVFYSEVEDHLSLLLKPLLTEVWGEGAGTGRKLSHKYVCQRSLAFNTVVLWHTGFDTDFRAG